MLTLASVLYEDHLVLIILNSCSMKAHNEIFKFLSVRIKCVQFVKNWKSDFNLISIKGVEIKIRITKNMQSLQSYNFPKIGSTAYGTTA